MILTSDLVIQIIHKIDVITDKFYQQEEQEGYQLLTQSLDLFSQVMEQLLTNEPNETVPQQHQEIIYFLEEILQAMEVKDFILLADIMQYELRERFQTILDTVKEDEIV